LNLKNAISCSLLLEGVENLIAENGGLMRQVLPWSHLLKGEGADCRLPITEAETEISGCLSMSAVERIAYGKL
jgi:hypothetical protein